jgi:replicative DNA helicase
MTYAHVLPPLDEPMHRQSPHNIEVEQALLGAILINNEAFYRVSDFLEPGHFFDPLHRQIYEKAAQLIRLGKAADPRTIKSYLKENDLVGDISVAEYLGRLAYEATTIINAEDYGRTIYDLSIRRNLITIGEDMVNIAYEAPVDMAPRAQIEDAERRLFELAETGRFNSGFQGFAEALKAAIDMAGNAYQRAGHLSGLATGLDDMDRMMGGLQNSDLVILAGRPGMGKTALATNIAYNVARAWRGEQQPDGSIKTVDGGIVGFFSLEMSAEQLATRVLAEQAGVPSSDIRRGNIHEDQFDRIVEVAQEMQRIPSTLTRRAAFPSASWPPARGGSSGSGASIF